MGFFLAILVLGGAAAWLYQASNVAPAQTAFPAVTLGQVPPIAQETPWTCGPAALRAVLAHHGIDVTELEAAAAVSNAPIIGTRVAGLVDGARRLGLHAAELHPENIGALRPVLAAGCPVIALVDSFTRPGRQGHYVVVTRMDGDLVTLLDPHYADGRAGWRRMTRMEFEARWWNRGSDGNIERRTAVLVVPADEEDDYED